MSELSQTDLDNLNVADERRVGQLEALAFFGNANFKEFWQPQTSISRYATATAGGAGALQTGGFYQQATSGAGTWHALLCPFSIATPWGEWLLRARFRLPVAPTVNTRAGIEMQLPGSATLRVGFGFYGTGLSAGSSNTKFSCNSFDGGVWGVPAISTVTVDANWHTLDARSDGTTLSISFDSEAPVASLVNLTPNVEVAPCSTDVYSGDAATPKLDTEYIQFFSPRPS